MAALSCDRRKTGISTSGFTVSRNVPTIRGDKSDGASGRRGRRICRKGQQN